MQQKKLVSAIALMGSMALLAGCNSGDNVDVNLGSSSSSSTSSGTSAPDNCPSWTQPAVVSDLGVCQIRDDITQDRTLTSDLTWQLVGKIRVGDGDDELAGSAPANSATLTIQPGTEIRSDVGGYLVVTRGSKLMAEGTESNPITFSSIDSDYSGAGEWGGVVLQGYAPNNQDTSAPIDVAGEAGLGYYGGNNADDNSGSLKYVRITEGGYEIAPGEEINGLTMMAVGRGTTVDYVQINDNGDDGVEFFGGTPNISHLVLTNNLDDSIDWDLGFQGNIQYALVIKTGQSDNGMETDNDGSNFDNTPRSRPTLANVTIVGASGAGYGAKHREGTGAFVYNSIYTGDDECLDVDDQSSQITSSPAELVYTNVVFNCTANTAGDAETSGNDYASLLVAAGGITTEDPMLDSNYRATAGSAASTLGSPVDFAAAQDASVRTATSFMTPTDYIGAVAPNATTFWFSGWTLDGTL
ncbi:hypothetical protein QQM79_09695 [Marinobacteraceae bacterium S3BR75-40.1]